MHPYLVGGFFMHFKAYSALFGLYIGLDFDAVRGKVTQSSVSS